MERADDRQERKARILGVLGALAVMAIASRLIRWPAPGIAIAVGLGVYWLARGADRAGLD